ncbi:hypothetical protein BbiDN127_C0008 (plasmid) [Borreliella bissettiae DN127]|uniref:Uncharacterized protein n=1 Tax=Borrelia bissettiae (strain DSM 17990 / CIP 109136 / DN127) TaxID=521010 RepID=G0ANX4_BORBD|nr:hypothetical protein [Borreliella bissettiae]AEL19400.1 hypothetical protein BbiDN127_C0008 [Borreliella bissettiae DN127]
MNTKTLHRLYAKNPKTLRLRGFCIYLYIFDLIFITLESNYNENANIYLVFTYNFLESID